MPVNPYSPSKFTGQDGAGIGRPRKLDGGEGFLEDDARVVREVTVGADVVAGDSLTIQADLKFDPSAAAGGQVNCIAAEDGADGDRVLCVIWGAVYVKTSGVTAEDQLSASATAGTLVTATAGDASVGVALEDTDTTIAGQSLCFIGGSGTGA